MRICLSNPPWRTSEARGIRAGCRVPNALASGEHTFIPFPYTLAYATAVLERAGFRAIIIDAIAEDLDTEAYFERVVAFAPDLIINEIATQSHPQDLAMAQRLKLATGARVALCGPHASALAGEILEEADVDYVLLGEYEQTALELAHALKDGTPVHELLGLSCRLPDGRVSGGSKRALIADLDSLPFPHRATLPLDRYRVGGFPAPVLYMYTTRGCPYRCNFCVWPQWFGSGTYRMRAPEKVIEEIEEAVKLGPFRSIYFDDDTLNIHKPRTLALVALLKQRVSLPWGCNARPDLFDDELMRACAEAGMFTIRIGVESGDPEVLRRIKKNLKLESVERCITLAHAYGIKVHVTFTVGLSGESWDSVERTATFAKGLRADSMAFTVTTPFPGTSYYDEVVANGQLVSRDWERFNVVSDSVVRTETMTSEEIVEAERYVKRQVYTSPGYVLRRLRYAKDTGELHALVKKGAKVLLRQL